MVNIVIWNNKELQQHLDQTDYETYEKKNGRTKFKGFGYFGPNWVSARPDFDRVRDMETWPTTNPFPKDQNIMALQDQRIIGLFSLVYGFNRYNFPNYYPKILEVRKDKRNQGIATSLVRRLKQPCFLEGNVLRIRDSSYTSDGWNYLKKVFDRELKDVPFRFVDGTLKRLEDYPN